jgi:hypothetical protein
MVIVDIFAIYAHQSSPIVVGVVQGVICRALVLHRTAFDERIEAGQAKKYITVNHYELHDRESKRQYATRIKVNILRKKFISKSF